MASKIQFKFDPNQEHQLIAVQSVLQLFDKLPYGHSEFKLGYDVVPNLSTEENFSEDTLLVNLNKIKESNGISQSSRLDVDEGLVLQGVGDDAWRYPSFTVEMETGTGKTYVYLRTIYELRKQFGFRKFIIVVPSIAIYEGVLKSIEITREHFKSLYNNEYMNVIAYDGDQISKLRDFATSQFLQVIIITMASFNRYSNKIYQRTEKLPGEKLPIQYVQETRPILILDECQNYKSQTSKEALRSLHPLCAFKYSATPGEKVQDGDREIMKYDNLIYRLTPVEAFRRNLVKKIQVLGVTEKENVDREYSMVLRSISSNLTATMILVVNNRGQFGENEVKIKNRDNLEAKTRNEKYRGFVVEEINKRDGKVIFTNGHSITLGGQQEITQSKGEIFKTQITETIRQHLERQEALKDKNIKVLSLIFVDRVASYIENDGIVKRLFDEAFEKLKQGYSLFEKRTAKDVREAYFAKRQTKEGEEFIDIDEEARNEEERKAQKEAFELIMKKKEQLLSFDEPVSFVFAHSALKEGWDNPNVFQICTLRETMSELRKRQEIGRGMRLCVDHHGNRIFDPDVNVLTVVANESYESFVQGLQNEYIADGEQAPERPSNAGREPAKRNDRIYGSDDFRSFWEKLIKRTDYKISIETDELIKSIVSRMNREYIPPPQVVIQRGKYVSTHFEIKLDTVTGGKATLEIKITDTQGKENFVKEDFVVRDDLSRKLSDERLRNYKIVKIDNDGPRVEFSEGAVLTKDRPIIFDSEKGQYVDSTVVMESAIARQVPNVIERAAKETDLTRPTIIKIFQSLAEKQKKMILTNPEGFINRFIFIIKDCLAEHVADKIQYIISGRSEREPKEKFFPPRKDYPQKEMIKGSPRSLYDFIQIDSDVERYFVEKRLNSDGKIVLYFKFPPLFKINAPRIIGNYNPDWAIVRLSEDGKYKLELVRETKGTMYPELLQYRHEKRKLLCGEKHFKQLGMSYRWIDPRAVVNWWEDKVEEETLDFFEKVVAEIEDDKKYTEYLPIYSLAAAAGKFSEGQEVQPEGWIKVDVGKKLDDKMFIAKVVGWSMEPLIPSGSFCVFSADVAGSRQGKVLLVEHHDITDPDTHSRYTVKMYRSEKRQEEDSWHHEKILLEPINKEYEPIIITEDRASEFRVIAEFVAVLKK